MEASPRQQDLHHRSQGQAGQAGQQRSRGDKRPSGLWINPAGTLALVANRAGKSISGARDPRHQRPAHRQHRHGRRGLRASSLRRTASTRWLSKASANKVAFAQRRWRQGNLCQAAICRPGYFPTILSESPTGAIALTADDGNNGAARTATSTRSASSIWAQPVHVIDHITVPDSPEGLAVSARKAISRWRSKPHG